MSVFEQIKDNDLNLFTQYHPKIIELKRKSKDLHKKLKKDKSLMQCQEIVAQENGFNNWHHFMAIIKKHYTHINDSAFTITQKRNEQLSDEHILIGHDINFNNYKWNDKSGSRTHTLILTPQYQEYNVFLMKQVIENDKKLIVMNPNKETLDKIISHAVKNNREQDLKFINFSDEIIYPQYQHYLSNTLSMGSGGLGEILISLIKRDSIVNEAILGKCISLIISVLMYMVYIREDKKIKTNFVSIKKYLNLDNILKEYYEDSKMPPHIKFALKHYLSSLPQFNNESVIQSKITVSEHIKTVSFFTTALSALENSHAFKEEGINYSKFLEPNDKSILIFKFSEENNEENVLYQKFIISLIRQSLSINLGKTIEGTYSSSKSSKPPEANKYLFMLNTSLVAGVVVMPAQSKATGLCLHFSYPSIEAMEKIMKIEEIKTIIANCNTKVLTSENKKKLFELAPYMIEDINEKIEECNLIKQESSKTLWLLKKRDSFQIDF